MENQNSNSITFDNMPSVVAKVCNEVSIIRNQLEELKNSFEPKTPNEYLTRNEVAEMLKCDLSTVHNWTAAVGGPAARKQTVSPSSTVRA